VAHVVVSDFTIRVDVRNLDPRKFKGAGGLACNVRFQEGKHPCMLSSE
jgi:hypothetical protein